MSDQKPPKFMKDSTGFCYIYTDTLATQKHLTPYDGEIDANGMAAEARQKKTIKKTDLPPAVDPAAAADPAQAQTPPAADAADAPKE